MIDPAIVDLAISMFIIDLASYSTVPGAQPNQDTTGDTGTRFLPEQVMTWTQHLPGVCARSRLPAFQTKNLLPVSREIFL